MAQFDVFRIDTGQGYLLDCQSDLLSELSHRFTVPVLPVADAPIAARKLNAIFVVEGQPVVMLTQFAAAVPRTELRDRVTSLADQWIDITAAIDVLLSGV